MENGQPPLSHVVPPEKLPRHIAIIMDGNGRWAKRQGKPRLAGHEAGSETVRRLLGYCRDAGIAYLTLYAFSTENWSRPPEEVAGLMNLLGYFIRKNEADLLEKKVRLRVIGRREDLPEPLQADILRLERETAQFERQLLIGLSYSGRSEIARAARRLAEQVKAGTLAPEAIDEAAVAANLYAPDVPDPDLIIRTSGELRTSNFLTWQAAYSELMFTDTYWPDFTPEEFEEMIKAYGNRERRFGGRKEEDK